MKIGAALLLLASLSASAAKRPACPRVIVHEPLRPEEIHYRVLGAADAPALVMIHGLGGSSSSFADLGPALSNSYRVILYDQRGHGYTSQRGWDYSLEVMAGDLKSLLDHLGVEKAHILGTSFGARTAMRFSTLYPERVRTLLVEDMEMIPRVVDYEAEYLEKARLSENLPRYFASRQNAYAALRPFFSHWEALDAIESGVDHEDGRFELLLRPHGMFLYDLGGNGVDLTEPLRNCTAPLLFVRADPARSFLTDAGVEHLRRVRPDVELITVPGADHVVHGSHPRRFQLIARDFFR